MRILVGYDGSPAADVAIQDLARAGLPAKTEVRVLTVADVWPELPASCFEPLNASAAAHLSSAVRKAHEIASHAMAEAAALALRGAEQVRSLLPDLTVTHEAVPDSPSLALVRRAEEWPADLIVVGDHSRSATNRILLGSVSRNAMTYAPCSVRIARAADKQRRGPLTLIVGVDGSFGSGAALDAVSMRLWPADTTVYVAAVVDARLMTMGLYMDNESPNSVERATEACPTWIKRMTEHGAAELRSTGLKVIPLCLPGTAAEELAHLASERGADCIFVGARGHSRLQRLLLGSVSTSLAAMAPCSVEIIR